MQSFLEFHERQGGLSVDPGPVSLPVENPAPVAISGGRLTADERHDGITRNGLEIEHPGTIRGNFHHLQDVYQVYVGIPLEEAGRFPGLVNALLEIFNGGVLVVRRNEQVELAMAALRFILHLLVGGVKEFADVDHHAPSLVWITSSARPTL